MNKLSLVAAPLAALALNAAPVFADQAPASTQIAAQTQPAAPRQATSHYLFRGSAFASVGRAESRQ